MFNELQFHNSIDSNFYTSSSAIEFRSKQKGIYSLAKMWLLPTSPSTIRIRFWTFNVKTKEKTGGEIVSDWNKTTLKENRRGMEISRREDNAERATYGG